ncbi:MAG: 1-deoxy-D-xylulose-5-phosphate reductoisomerase [Planctomycetota bacterium]
MAKNIAILGSTGSIGTSTLKVLDALGSDYRVFALTAHSNVELLAGQVRKYRPQLVGITCADQEGYLRRLLADVDTEILAGPSSLEKIAADNEVDTIVAAVVGAAGLPALLEGAKNGKTLAIANKEPLVIAGQLLTRAARENSATILPVDSEHSAVFQAMQAGRREEVNRIILTASGGPFRTATAEQIENATLDDALAHPTWDMGPKVTVDSATMMNKALEVIEAHWLFDKPPEKIDVLIHPESIVHSLVEFIDGSVIAQLGTPDMCLPIQYAITYPQRVKGISPHLRLDELGRLTFEKPNLKTFRALALGFEVAGIGDSAPVVFNAANEQAVHLFLNGKIKFSAIVELIERCLDKHNIHPCESLEELLEADRWARNEVNRCLSNSKTQKVL